MLQSVEKETEVSKSKLQELSDQLEEFSDCPQYEQMKEDLSEMQEDLVKLCENIKQMTFVFTLIIGRAECGLFPELGF